MTKTLFYQKWIFNYLAHECANVEDRDYRVPKNWLGELKNEVTVAWYSQKESGVLQEKYTNVNII